MSSPVVTAQHLLAETVSAAPLLVDVRWTLAGAQRDAYLDGHLPGAVFCDLDAELAAPPGDGGRHPLPTPEGTTALLRRLGVTPDRRVVVYDGGPSMAAARAWWVLRWAGHDDVRVLDGGLPAWVAAGGETEPGDVVPVPAPDVLARTGAMPVLTTDDVLARVVLPVAPGSATTGPGDRTTLLDARPAERFRGETEPIDPVAGHVPGAVSCPAGAVQHADGRLLDEADLRVAFEAVLTRGRPVGASCGSGVSACVLVLALEVVGVRAALYAGSWSAWVGDAGRPVATGA